MNKVKVITDACASLSIEELKNLDVDYVQMGIVIGDEAYDSFDYPEKNPTEFYKMLERTKKCSTSCVNTQNFLEIFEKYLKEGFDVFYVGLSGGLSCTYHNALSVAEELNKTYGERVFVADSLTGSYGIAIMVEHAVKMRDEGKSAKEIFEAINKNALNVFSVFMPGDLQFLMRCGRINAIVASVGTVLKLVPVIVPDDKGKLKTVNKCLGHRKAMKTIQAFVEEHDNLELEETIYIGHTGQEEMANELASYINEKYPNKKVKIGYIDYTMGCCCGPSTLAVFGISK